MPVPSEKEGYKPRAAIDLLLLLLANLATPEPSAGPSLTETLVGGCGDTPIATSKRPRSWIRLEPMSQRRSGSGGAPWSC
jgi:hypothetical protein